jgi:DOPA 4,5-dioxygenase
MRYHAHIYWKNETQRDEAISLRPALQKLGCKIGSIHDELIGPHPCASYQANYDSSIAELVEQLLASSSLDILLHEDTGDDMRDHTLGARWIGNQLALDLEWLRSYINGDIHA